uniref:Uncharacterized protein n=2 Tax=Eptatretus burgeri TaxID=7764 RepID=A0A8C4R4J8_EPTBU
MLPPTTAALDLHLKRANFQTKVWLQADKTEMELPTPASTGAWKENDDGQLQVVWIRKPSVPQSCQALISCGCKTQLRSHEHFISLLSLTMFADVSAFIKGLVLGSVSCVLASLLAGGIHKTNTQFAYMNHNSHQHIKLPLKEELNERHHLTPPRVLCLVLTKPKTLNQWGAVRRTWTSHCDKTIFYSPENAKVSCVLDLHFILLVSNFHSNCCKDLKSTGWSFYLLNSTGPRSGQNSPEVVNSPFSFLISVLFSA